MDNLYGNSLVTPHTKSKLGQKVIILAVCKVYLSDLTIATAHIFLDGQQSLTIN